MPNGHYDKQGMDNKCQSCVLLKKRYIKDIEYYKGKHDQYTQCNEKLAAENEKLKKALRGECLLTDRLEKDIKELQMELGNVGHVEADLVEEIEQLKEACERKDAVLKKAYLLATEVTRAHKGYMGDHYVYTPQIDKNSADMVCEEIKKELSE